MKTTMGIVGKVQAQEGEGKNWKFYNYIVISTHAHTTFVALACGKKEEEGGGGTLSLAISASLGL